MARIWSLTKFHCAQSIFALIRRPFSSVSLIICLCASFIVPLLSIGLGEGIMNSGSLGVPFAQRDKIVWAKVSQPSLAEFEEGISRIVKSGNLLYGKTARLHTTIFTDENFLRKWVQCVDANFIRLLDIPAESRHVFTSLTEDGSVVGATLAKELGLSSAKLLHIGSRIFTSTILPNNYMGEYGEREVFIPYNVSDDLKALQIDYIFYIQSDSSADVLHQELISAFPLEKPYVFLEPFSIEIERQRNSAIIGFIIFEILAIIGLIYAGFMVRNVISLKLESDLTHWGIARSFGASKRSLRTQFFLQMLLSTIVAFICTGILLRAITFYLPVMSDFGLLFILNGRVLMQTLVLCLSGVMLITIICYIPVDKQEIYNAIVGG